MPNMNTPSFKRETADDYRADSAIRAIKILKNRPSLSKLDEDMFRNDIIRTINEITDINSLERLGKNVKLNPDEMRSIPLERINILNRAEEMIVSKIENINRMNKKIKVPNLKLVKQDIDHDLNNGQERIAS